MSQKETLQVVSEHNILPACECINGKLNFFFTPNSKRMHLKFLERILRDDKWKTPNPQIKQYDLSALTIGRNQVTGMKTV